MRLVAIILLLLSSHMGQAQNDTVLLDNKFALKTSPLAFIDPYGSYSYRLGMECKLVKNIAFSIEAGQYYNVGGRFQVKINPKGYIIRPEIKYYLNRDRLTMGDYISLDFFTRKSISIIKAVFSFIHHLPIKNNIPFGKKYIA